MAFFRTLCAKNVKATYLSTFFLNSYSGKRHSSGWKGLVKALRESFVPFGTVSGYLDSMRLELTLYFSCEDPSISVYIDEFMPLAICGIYAYIP